MSPLTLALLFSWALPDAAERPAFLFNMDSGSKGAIHLRGERYRPRPGDIVLFDHHIKAITNLYRFCGTSSPVHAGVVFQKRDGKLGILEAGPNTVQKVLIFDIDDRLHKFDGTILVRQLKSPLTANQSRRLTEFSHEQEGKGYALGRLISQATPFRPQGSLRGQLFGKTVLNRERWMCSEIVVAAMAVAGVLDAKAYPANAMYPRDLCYDERHDLSAAYQEPALWSPREQVDFLGGGVRVPTGK